MNDIKIQDIEKSVRKHVGTTNSVAVAPISHGQPQRVDTIVAKAVEGSKEIARTPLSERQDYIDKICEKLSLHARELSEMEKQETGMGRVEDKVSKILMTVKSVPGIDDIKPNAVVGDYGLGVEEYLPFGVALCITPSTAPSCTAIGNTICMIASGNSVIFSPHPNALQCTLRVIKLINEAIKDAGGSDNIVNCVEESSLSITDQLIGHPDIDLLVATGGPAIVKKLMSSGKKAIGAGAGNPPVLVDECANLNDAARCIIAGNYFENGIQCVCEKGIIVLDSVADELLRKMKQNGAYILNEQSRVDALTNLVTTESGNPNKDCIGRDPSIILNAIGIDVPADTKSIVYEVTENHITFMEEYLMPLLPVVRVKTFEEGLRLAVKMEGGRRHTAAIHSQDITHLSDYVRALHCTVMVKNGPTYSGLGMGGEGYYSVTVAGPSGEGITSPKTFTRSVRCTMVGEFNLRTSSI